MNISEIIIAALSCVTLFIVYIVIIGRCTKSKECNKCTNKGYCVICNHDINNRSFIETLLTVFNLR